MTVVVSAGPIPVGIESVSVGGGSGGELGCGGGCGGLGGGGDGGGGNGGGSGDGGGEGSGGSGDGGGGGGGDGSGEGGGCVGDCEKALPTIMIRNNLIVARTCARPYFLTLDNNVMRTDEYTNHSSIARHAACLALLFSHTQGYTCHSSLLRNFKVGFSYSIRAMPRNLFLAISSPPTPLQASR